MKHNPTIERYWLKQHQITAFWHGFGISNGKEIPKEMTEEVYTDFRGRYKNSPQAGGKTLIRVKPEYFRVLLADYIQWLEQYAKRWDRETSKEIDEIDTREKFLMSENSHASRKDVLGMIELLQEYRIDDK